MNNRSKTHLDTNNILKDTQHGFRNHRGTNTAITTVHENIAHLIARRQQCYIILRDVSKAFDKVWHEGLQTKIAQIQLPLVITKFFNNFIKDRSAKIKIEDYIGPPFQLQADVPQGSALSPTLYSIYTNDLPPSAIDFTNIQYADITQIVSYARENPELSW